ncbi:MAG: heavy-metal-associated domain-containing protein [Rhodospirillales bacterium]|nr:heavy-metal-associated domain-containing protein [Alphaproteobacteria bacterium]MBL6947821.1 heavy-metal-associated domain-containing protein [Rhodospirillales bacterium]
MKKYKVLGMSCAGCANSVSKALKAVVPEASVDVNLDSKEVRIEGIAEDTAVQQAVEGAGFEYGGPV